MSAGTAASPPPEPGRLKRAGTFALFLLAVAGIGAALSIGFLVAASRFADKESEDATATVAPPPAAPA